jgi:hypothetical protein
VSVRHADIGSGSDVGFKSSFYYSFLHNYRLISLVGGPGANCSSEWLLVAHAEDSLWAGVAQQATRAVLRLRAFVYPFVSAGQCAVCRGQACRKPCDLAFDLSS